MHTALFWQGEPVTDIMWAPHHDARLDQVAMAEILASLPPQNRPSTARGPLSRYPATEG